MRRACGIQPNVFFGWFFAALTLLLTTTTVLDNLIHELTSQDIFYHWNHHGIFFLVFNFGSRVCALLWLAWMLIISSRQLDNMPVLRAAHKIKLIGMMLFMVTFPSTKVIIDPEVSMRPLDWVEIEMDAVTLAGLVLLSVFLDVQLSGACTLAKSLFMG